LESLGLELQLDHALDVTGVVSPTRPPTRHRAIAPPHRPWKQRRGHRLGHCDRPVEEVGVTEAVVNQVHT
jgi:hypothetical protein